MEEMICRKPKS